MAVVTFTSNASTGAGSLAEAVKNAQPGDVIRPDETVFERGSTIEIILASTLNVDKSLTFDGGPYRVRLDGDGLARCCNVASGVNVEITAFDIVGGGWNSQTGLDCGSANGAGVSVAGDSSIVLKRCGFFGCRGSFGGGLSIAANSTAELSDCVIVGCYARGSGAGLRSQGLTKVYSSTIIGNVGAGSTTAHDVLVDGSGCATFVNSIVRKCSGNVEIGAGCVVGVAPSQIGFVAPPPDDLSAETWNANAWRNWDLRLLDDASPNPSPYRDAGDVDAASKHDFDGNFRGREANGVATCSPGAFETLQADLFWIGRDATGAEVVSPSWINANGWAASRFATASGDVAPQANDNIFIDGVVSIDGTSLAFTRFIVGGGAKIGFSASGTKTLSATFYDVGVGATVESTAGTQKLGVRDSANVSRFGDYAFIHIPMSASANQNFQIAQTARFSDFANSDIVYAAGNFVIYRFNLSSGAQLDGDVENVVDLRITANTRQLTASNSPRIRCERFTWTRASGQTGPGLTDGSTPLTIAPTTLVSATLNAPGDFSVDVSKATNLSLSLSGQTVYGDALSSAVSLTGSATIDKRGLASQSLTLNADATLNVDGGLACVGELTVADGASVAFSSERGDAVLTATESATVDAASFAGAGYFATPPGTDLNAATFAETVRACYYGAGISAFSAVAISPTEAAIEWSATDETATICVERKTSSGWEVVDVRGESGLTAAIATPGATVFRAFDGAAFWSDSAWFLTGEQFTVETDFFAVAEDGAESVEYETETHIVTTNIDKSIYWGQSLTFLARIRNAFTGDLLLNDGTRTKGVRYSLYRREGSLFSTSEDDVPVRLDVDAGAACLLETAQTSDAWPGVEYNFALIPANSADEPLIPAPGNYVLRVFVELTTGNPIVFVYTFAAR